MGLLLGVLTVAGVLGVCCFALWAWREYLIGFFIGGGGGPASDADRGSDSSEGGSTFEAIDSAGVTDYADNYSADGGHAGGADF